MVIPKMFDTEFLPKVKEGEKVLIKGEFKPPEDFNPKFKGFLMGEVEYKNSPYLLSLNKTSYQKICANYDKDTKMWRGKELVYKGEERMGQMIGKIWEAVK